MVRTDGKVLKTKKNNAEKTESNVKHQIKNAVHTFGMFPRECVTTEQSQYSQRIS